MAAELTVERVREELRNGDTAGALASRLHEPGGEEAAHTARRVVACLEEMRLLGEVERFEPLYDEEETKTAPPVRWRHASGAGAVV
jgi:hypothetical protein